MTSYKQNDTSAGFNSSRMCDKVIVVTLSLCMSFLVLQRDMNFKVDDDLCLFSCHFFNSAMFSRKSEKAVPFERNLDHTN